MPYEMPSVRMHYAQIRYIDLVAVTATLRHSSRLVFDHHDLFCPSGLLTSNIINLGGFQFLRFDSRWVCTWSPCVFTFMHFGFGVVML